MGKLFSKFFVMILLAVSINVRAQLPDFTGLVESEGMGGMNINTTQTVRQRQIDPFLSFLVTVRLAHLKSGNTRHVRWVLVLLFRQMVM